jgi:OmpA-OmpF porin, OOP family
LIPEGVTPLQVLRNYQGELAKTGGQVLFECAKEQCGPQSNMVGKGGGSIQNLSQYMWDQDRIKERFESAAECAQRGWVSELRFTAMEVPQQASHLTLQTYQMVDSCRKIVGRTIAIVDVIEGKVMDRNMVVLDAGQMSKSIAAEGRVALYGLFFDSGKSQVKPESKPTLQQIANLLSTNPRLGLLVVGHTDNAGTFASNMELSRRRAEAVVEALVSQHHIAAKRLQAVGVSFASPVASNVSEEGKAKNRRVELVPAD